MGNGSSSTIAINLDRTNSFYFAGELVSGTVGLNIIKSKIETGKIYLMLIGEIGYTKTRTVTEDDGGTTRQNDYHHVPFYSTKIILARPEAGQKELVYSQGQYSCPFQIPLSNHLPPTMNQPQSYPRVRYYLQVVIDKPWDKPNEKEKRYLTIYPRLNLLQNPQCLVSTLFGNHNRTDISLRGTFNKLGYVTGELITGILEIENPRRVLIQRINLSIIQFYRIGPNPRRNRIFKATLPPLLNVKDKQTRKTFSAIIPAFESAVSYQFERGIQTTANVHIHYLLKFAVKIGGMFTDFNVDIPITLGTEPYPDQNQQQTFNPLIVSYSSDSEQTMFSDDSPPSYDSIFQNKK